ncbi:MAG: hypothetical protein EOL87_14255 [Spartobacteria bacterium]|nr:hypothetical protein [Spartobacteria bacterium]
MPNHQITVADIYISRATYEANEPRDLFYKAATQLVLLSLAGRTTLTISEAIAVLLQTWNREFYRFRKFSAQHFAAIDKMLLSQKLALSVAQNKDIQKLTAADEASAKQIFVSFEMVLGPVGAAKSLHLFAPDYFPLWDRAIATAYVGVLGKIGSNGDRYWKMMNYASRQAQALVASGYSGKPLKAIDEYNYCHFTKKWM